MNDDERNDQREDQGIFNKLKKGHKKGNKSIFKMMLKKAITIILPVLLKIMVPLIILVCVWSAITHILDIRGSTDIVDVASSAIINENSEIVKAEDGEGYYFKIKNTIDGRHRSGSAAQAGPPHPANAGQSGPGHEIGRASCRERV